MLNKLIDDLRTIFSKYSSNFVNSAVKIITTLAAFVAILAFLQTRNINVVKILSQFIQGVANFLQITNVPVITWILLIIIGIFIYWQTRKINLVAGEFFDNFKQGLSNWEYGNEGWKTEREDNELLLSVSESPEGGVSKKGFSWTDYQFSFEMKLVNKNAGWIVRAENRNKYLMIQFNLKDTKQPKLRLHLKIPPSDRNYQWVVLQEDIISQIPIDKLEWMEVKIVVLGNNIDAYINKKHTAHYIIPDPIIWMEDYRKLIGHEQVKPSKEDIQKTRNITFINASAAGRVGFRCYGDEHAHFKNVRVKPLL